MPGLRETPSDEAALNKVASGTSGARNDSQGPSNRAMRIFAMTAWSTPLPSYTCSVSVVRWDLSLSMFITLQKNESLHSHCLSLYIFHQRRPFRDLVKERRRTYGVAVVRVRYH
jgi:hypothetical protein